MWKKTITAIVIGVLAVSLWAVPTAGADVAVEHVSSTTTAGRVSIGSSGLGSSPSAPGVPNHWHVY